MAMLDNNTRPFALKTGNMWPRPESRPSIAARANGAEKVAWSVVGQDCPPLFTGILPSDYAKISAEARMRIFARGEMIFFEGSSVRQVVLLTSGFIKITKLGPGGAEVILRLVGPGDVLGAAELFAAGAHGTTAQAFRSCQALVWEARSFQNLIHPHPILSRNLASILGKELLELGDRFREVATERVAPRVARQVFRLANQIGLQVNGAVEIGLSREELAQMTGTTLFTVSRLFSTWEGRGILKPRREAVAICNMRALQALAEEGNDSSTWLPAKLSSDR